MAKLLYLGSSCIYPRECPQPMKEEHLLSGYLEPTNEPYAIAKIAGIKLCQAYRRQYGCNFICAMPTNLYGPGDNFDLRSSHVLPALIRKFHEAKVEGRKEVVVWGTGTPRREFLHVDDLADACLFIMRHWEEDLHINVATGETHSVREFCQLAFEYAGIPLRWRGKDQDEQGVGPDGRVLVEVDPRYFRPTEVDHLLGDPSKAQRKLGWRPKFDFKGLVRMMMEADLLDASAQNQPSVAASQLRL